MGHDRQHAIEHRATRPYTPKTNGMVERFNGRVQREVLGITIYSHQDLEILLTGFNVAYNGRRQRTLKGLSPEKVLHQRLKDKPALARMVDKKADLDALDRALKVVADAKEVSQPDNHALLKRCHARRAIGPAGPLLQDGRAVLAPVMASILQQAIY